VTGGRRDRRHLALKPWSPHWWRWIDRLLRRTLPADRYGALVAEAKALNAAHPDGVPGEILNEMLSRAVAELERARGNA